ncbi:MAG: SDR family oxidoreductase [Bacteroidota bacterium]
MLYHRVLVTGANGLVGQAVVRRFTAVPEIDVLATSREDHPRFQTANCGYVPLDLTDTEAVRNVFMDFAPRSVINCAAIAKVEACEADREACWAVNVEAVETLASACRAHGTRLIQVSTDFVFDGETPPYAEDEYPAPVNYYGRSKLAAENAVRGAGLHRWAVARTALVYGAGEDLRRRNIAVWLCSALKAGETVRVVTDLIRTPTFVDDLADGLLRIEWRGKSGLYHLAGRETMTVFDFARRLAVHFGFDPELVQPITAEALHPGHPRPRATPLLILRAESELGYKPRPLDAALDRLGTTLGIPVPNKKTATR